MKKIILLWLLFSTSLQAITLINEKQYLTDWVAYPQYPIQKAVEAGRNGKKLEFGFTNSEAKILLFYYVAAYLETHDPFTTKDAINLTYYIATLTQGVDQFSSNATKILINRFLDLITTYYTYFGINILEQSMDASVSLLELLFRDKKIPEFKVWYQHTYKLLLILQVCARSIPALGLPQLKERFGMISIEYRLYQGVLWSNKDDESLPPLSLIQSATYQSIYTLLKALEECSRGEDLSDAHLNELDSLSHSNRSLFKKIIEVFFNNDIKKQNLIVPLILLAIQNLNTENEVQQAVEHFKNILRECAAKKIANSAEILNVINNSIQYRINARFPREKREERNPFPNQKLNWLEKACNKLGLPYDKVYKLFTFTSKGFIIALATWYSLKYIYRYLPPSTQQKVRRVVTYVDNARGGMWAGLKKVASQYRNHTINKPLRP